MNKYDSNIGLQGGGATIGRGNGSTAMLAASGAVALQQLQNRMLSQMNIDHRLEAGRNQEAHRTQIASEGDQQSFRHGDSSALTDAKGHDATRGNYQQSGVQVANSVQGSVGGSHSTGQNLGKSFRENSNFNMRAGASDNLGMNLGVGRGTPGGGAVPTAGGGGAPDPREEKRIADAMHQGGANQAQVDQALKNYRGGKGGAAPAGGISLNAGLGFDSKKSYDAGHLRSREIGTQHGLEESARTERGYQEVGSRTTQGGSGTQSNQMDRHGRDASLSNVDEVSRVRDVSDRREFGIGDRANRSESNSFATHKDLLADPISSRRWHCAMA